MTFIRSQAEALEGFEPHYVGSRAVAFGGLELPPDRTLIINRSGSRCGKIREVPFKVLAFDPLFFRRVRQLKPALVHAHFGPSAVVALPLVQHLRVPLIVTFHGYDATVRQECANKFHYTFRAYWRKKALLQHRASLFIAVSEFIRKKLLEQGYPNDRILVHYIGVDTEFFQADPSVSRRPIVLFAARLMEKKGCEYVIRAMEKVQASHPSWELVIIGDGPLRQSLEQLAREKLRRFRFLGVQPAAVIRDWMNQSNVFCVPSVVARDGDAEGFGLVFAEAQAMGLPVVSFASGGVPEAVAHGEAGLLAPEQDWGVLAKHLCLLVNSPDLRRRMGDAGRKRVCAKFDLMTQTKKLEEIYRQVISGLADAKTQDTSAYVASTKS
jgi:glycosyltransferase involved in cell wall biosynthesis